MDKNNVNMDVKLKRFISDFRLFSPLYLLIWVRVSIDSLQHMAKGIQFITKHGYAVANFIKL